MAHVLRMAALQVRHPVALVVLMEADDTAWHGVIRRVHHGSLPIRMSLNITKSPARL